MTEFTIPSTEFQSRAGAYIERSAKEPVFITKHNRPVRVLLDIEAYRKLQKTYREAMLVAELDDVDLHALLTADLPAEATELNHLMADSSEA